MKNYQPYQFWTKSQLADHLKKMSQELDLDKEIRILIEAAIGDLRWNPIKDFDGCSAVEDLYHPSLSCFIHDYLWKTGQGGREADRLFYLLMLVEKTHKAKARRRWLGVRVAWFAYFKWYHFVKRNVNPYSELFLASLKSLELLSHDTGRKS